MALIWARLNAVDIALAEAAIGAGLTGALLISAIPRHNGTRNTDTALETPVPGPKFGAQRFALGFLSTGLGGTLVWLIANLPQAPERLRQEILSRLDIIGIKNPVTAALLDFRGYDTLLEVAVLMLAVVALRSIAGRIEVGDIERPEPSLNGMFNWLVPASIMVAGYLLWRGADHPGGAFQAGAVLAGAGVLMTFTWPIWVRGIINRPAVRLAVALAPLVFLVVGIGTTIHSGFFLHYPVGLAPVLMLIIETAVMISVAIILLSLFLGCRGVIRDGEIAKPPADTGDSA